MKVERITYKRVKNLGNYESETCEMTAILDEDEEVEEAVTKLKNLVHWSLKLHLVEKEDSFSF